MAGISVVIICKNEADIIGRTLQSLQGLTDDIVVYDNGSNDGTKELVRSFNVRLEEGSWEGFGKTKMKAIKLARYDWILSLDADESIDEELKRNLQALDLSDEHVVYDIRFKNFLGDTWLRHGEWGGDHHIRLFNRRQVSWNEAPVHETLILPPSIKILTLDGYVLHRTMKDVEDYRQKMLNYAQLNAKKYYQQGRRSSWFKQKISPSLTFLHYYVIKAGFLDGKAGYICAKMTAWYTFLKYAHLKELNQKANT